MGEGEGGVKNEGPKNVKKKLKKVRNQLKYTFKK